MEGWGRGAEAVKVWNFTTVDQQVCKFYTVESGFEGAHAILVPNWCVFAIPFSYTIGTQ